MSVHANLNLPALAGQSLSLLVDQISRGAGCRRSIIDLLQAVDDHASDPAHNEPHLFKKGAAAGASVLNDSNLRGGPHTARIKRSLSPSIPDARIGFTGERGTA
jgi:hypothetical protein